MELRIDQVTKRYGQLVALHEFTLTLRPGVVALLGPNGAGKTTLMNILATVTEPSSGTLTWDGEDVRKRPNALRRVLGYLPQDFGVYPNLNAIEFLSYIAAVKGLDARAARQRIDELLVLVNLSDSRKRSLGGFSGGMRQRLGIAQALLNDPKLLIVDEPTAGLDPEERVRFRNLLTELSGERIVLLSTHIVSDVEAVASEIALIDRGRLLLTSSPEAMLARAEGRVWSLTVPSEQLAALKQRWLISGTMRRSDGVEVRLVAESPPAGARPLPATLEDAYLVVLAGQRQDAKP